jgi:hypothetical protein
VITGIILDVPPDERAVVPLHLDHPSPNPFNPTTTISFDLPQAGHVRLESYDVLGRRVATILDEQRTAGRHSVVWDAGGLPSGVYLLKLTTAEESMTRKVVLLK